MRISTGGAPGLRPTKTGIAGVVERFEQLESDGFSSAWAGNHVGHDAMTVLAFAGSVTNRIELGTSIVATYPRHPMVMAQQALTTNLATGGRFTLGIGLSHQFIVESWQGLRWAPPLRHMREYLSVLVPLLEGKLVKFEGREFQVHLNSAPYNKLEVPETGRPQVLVAALGPGMLRVTGELADGTTASFCGPNYLETTVVPTITQAAQAAGRPSPRIMAGFSIALTKEVDSARESCSRGREIYPYIKSYRQVMTSEGVSGPGDLAIVGDEQDVRRQLKHLEGIGLTDFSGGILAVPEDADAPSRTYEFLKDVAKNGL